MAISLGNISRGKALRSPRIILLGVEKIGKSTFAAGADNAIFIPVKGEEGVDDLDVARFPVCQTWQDVIDCLGELYTQEHDFQTVVLDSASALEPLAWAETCRRNGNAESIEKVGGGYGKGYIEAALIWSELLEGLDALRQKRNMASILIGHVKVKRFDDPAGESYDRYWFDLHERAANAMFRWADSILFANTKVVVKKEDLGFQKEKHRGIDTSGGARFLFTQKRPAHPGGGRGAYGRIPYELPLDWATFTEAVTEASK